MNKSSLHQIFARAKSKPSVFAVVLILLVTFVVNITYRNWEHEHKIISWDVNSYYAYLPVVFIYNDLDMDFIHEDPELHKKHYWPLDTETGKRAIFTSMGMAFLYSPFFLAGHAYAEISGFPGDEFSAPYKISLILSCLFYLAIGLVFLRKVLLRYFSEPVTALTLLLLVFGTNLLHYITEEPTMTHAYNFSMISVFLYLLIRWFENPGVKFALLTGALAGLITLVRPSNVIVIILLVFWGITSFRDLGERILFYLRKFHLVALMIVAFFLVWVPQFLYWHYVSGSFLFNTYSSAGAGFFFDNPQVCAILFSYRKGWLLYTPLMGFALLGLFALYRQHKKLFFPVLIYLLINVYVISSWWCWWYGGGFGQRSFIDSYGLMAFPLAAFLTWVFRRKLFITIIFSAFLFLITALNAFQVYQYKQGLIHFVMMTKKTYWMQFLSTKVDRRYWNMLVFPDYNAAKQGDYYTEFEVPLKLEKTLGTRGWAYFEQTKDSIAADTSLLRDLMLKAGTESDTAGVIHEEALRRFRKIKSDFYQKEEELRKRKENSGK